MREVSSFILEQFDKDEIRTFSLIDLELESGYVYFTDGPHALTVQGETQEYSADIGILNYTAPKQTSIVDRESFSVSIEDVNGVFKSSINRSISGKNVRFRLGFYDGHTPNLDPENLIVAYKGYIDTVAYENDGDMASVSIECSSPMQDLALVKTIITSPKGMDQVNLSDTSFDKVIDQNEIMYKWGKE